jgi:hypothetical protein
MAVTLCAVTSLVIASIAVSIRRAAAFLCSAWTLPFSQTGSTSLAPHSAAQTRSVRPPEIWTGDARRSGEPVPGYRSGEVGGVVLPPPRRDKGRSGVLPVWRTRLCDGHLGQVSRTTTVGKARSKLRRQRSDQPLRVARPFTAVIGHRRSGWRRSVDHGRRSLRELGLNRVDQSQRAQPDHDLGGPRRSLTGHLRNSDRDVVVAAAARHP